MTFRAGNAASRHSLLINLAHDCGGKRTNAMKSLKAVFPVALAAAMLVVPAASSYADSMDEWHDGHDHAPRYDPRWHHDHAVPLSQRDVSRWHGGHWYHGRHDGRIGWWWIVGGVGALGAWYLYPAPIYPYPDPYADQPPVVVVQPPPAGAPQVQSWYHCDHPSGYYPYVQSCRDAWRPVPTTPSLAPTEPGPAR